MHLRPRGAIPYRRGAAGHSERPRECSAPSDAQSAIGAAPATAAEDRTCGTAARNAEARPAFRLRATHTTPRALPHIDAKSGSAAPVSDPRFRAAPAGTPPAGLRAESWTRDPPTCTYRSVRGRIGCDSYPSPAGFLRARYRWDR